MIRIVVQCIGIALLMMIHLFIQCFGISAHDELSCAMHWECIVFDKHSCGMRYNLLSNTLVISCL